MPPPLAGGERSGPGGGVPGGAVTPPPAPERFEDGLMVPDHPLSGEG